MSFATVLQTDLTGTGPVAVVVTAAVGWLFYAVTLHLAATFFVGDVPTQHAAKAGAVPAVVSVLLGNYGRTGSVLVTPGIDLLVAAVVTVGADALAISVVYDLDRRATAALTALHVAFAVALGVALSNLLGL